MEPLPIESSNPMQDLMNGGAAMMSGTAGQHDLISKANMVQVQVQVAKQYPRDWNRVRTQIVQQCQIPELAEVAMYAYPRGGKVVSGASIRLVEVMAAAMGNIDYGIVELGRKDDEVLLEAFAWDIEQNVRSFKRWTVPMVRTTRQGTYTLSDERDRYEMMANMGMRRVRSCLMSLIPPHIQQAGINAVNETLVNHSKLLSPEHQGRMLEAFGQHGVERQHIEKYLGHELSKLSRQEAINLSMISQSLSAGVGKPSDFFAGFVDKSAAAEKPANESVSRVQEKLKKRAAK